MDRRKMAGRFARVGARARGLGLVRSRHLGRRKIHARRELLGCPCRREGVGATSRQVSEAGRPRHRALLGGPSTSPLEGGDRSAVPFGWSAGEPMNNVSTAIVCITAALLSGCSVAPYKYPDTPPRQDLVPLDSTRIVVKEEFRYSPTLTSIVLPAGEYVPVKKDAAGTYYESPRGLLILPVAGQGSLVRGGIYRRQDPAVNYQ